VGSSRPSPVGSSRPSPVGPGRSGRPGQPGPVRPGLSGQPSLMDPSHPGRRGLVCPEPSGRPGPIGPELPHSPDPSRSRLSGSPRPPRPPSRARLSDHSSPARLSNLSSPARPPRTGTHVSLGSRAIPSDLRGLSLPSAGRRIEATEQLPQADLDLAGVHPGDRRFELSQDLSLLGPGPAGAAGPTARRAVSRSRRAGPIAVTSHDIGVSRRPRLLWAAVRSVATGHETNATGCHLIFAPCMHGECYCATELRELKFPDCHSSHDTLAP